MPTIAAMADVIMSAVMNVPWAIINVPEPRVVPVNASAAATALSGVITSPAIPNAIIAATATAIQPAAKVNPAARGTAATEVIRMISIIMIITITATIPGR